MGVAIASAGKKKRQSLRRAAMRKHTWKWFVAASAMAFLAPASVVVAGDQVPIKANLTIVPGRFISFNYPILTQTRLITGNVSHLGSCTGVALDQLDVTNAPFELSFFDCITLVAANGDTIVGFSTGTLVFNPTTGLYDITDEIVTITDGKGRFAGATGSATGVGTSTRAGVANESFQGFISTPGSLK
jgi:hypothetical protein